MFKKIIEFIKNLISKFLKKKAHATIQNEIATFKIVLPKALFKGLQQLEEITVTKSHSNNIQQIASKFIDFKTVELQCFNGSQSSKEMLVATLTNIKKENGKYSLTIKIKQ